MTPEAFARVKIDELLTEAGWKVQDKKAANFGARIGIAIREAAFKDGEADYVLFVNRVPVGVIEAKKIGSTLGGVSEQSMKYMLSFPKDFPRPLKPMCFHYESTGVETFFRDLRDPEARSRRVFAFHKPETLFDLYQQSETLRAKLRTLPELIKDGLRDCQIESIEELEESFAENQPRSLIQMATGAGKTFAAVTFVYRLIKFAKAKRVLFLVDRRTLGRQALTEFTQYQIPQDGRKFTELYNIQHLSSQTLDKDSQVCISTIQRVYSILSGNAEITEEDEEVSLSEYLPEYLKNLTVSYNPNFPLESFDFIIVDECHRSIYNLWRQVIEYFDSFIIGLTATPTKQTIGFFNGNLVSEYTHQRAVADGVNVGYNIYEINTKVTKEGGTVEAGFKIDIRDRLTRAKRRELLDADLHYQASQVDRDVVVPSQIRLIMKTFREKLFTEIFPGRTEVPKTLIFAKDDSHAEEIVNITREVFGKGNDFCKKITYQVKDAESVIGDFRNAYNPRIAVTVDMIAAGTDIKPLEIVMFMRDVKSSQYFEQMKGRGTRTISDTELRQVSGDAEDKTHFVIIDAVGVTKTDKTESHSLERKPSVSLEKLLQNIAFGKVDEDTVSTVAGRLAQIERKVNDKQRKEIQDLTNGKSINEIVKTLLQSIDIDLQIEKAKEVFAADEPNEAQVLQAADTMMREACYVFDNPDFRSYLVNFKKVTEQYIDDITQDEIIKSEFSRDAEDVAKETVKSFREFIEENKDEITALQIIYNQPYEKRHLTEQMVNELAEKLHKPPYNIAPQKLWKAYEILEKGKVRRYDKLLGSIVTMIRFALGKDNVLESWKDTVERRFNHWLSLQEAKERKFTPEQIEWLELMRNQIALNLSLDILDIRDAQQFQEKGGVIEAMNVFGNDRAVIEIVDELNESLAA
ncbi:MAG: type I restriction-modification enzyme R subunit C-terminal domain-containing protein [Pyrinomonadaceae bacterium]